MFFFTFLCFRSSFPVFFSQPSAAVPVMTSSGRVTPIAVGDTVLVVEDVRFRVTKLFPDNQTVILQKINTRERPFKRHINQLWVPPPVTVDASTGMDMPVQCDCPDPEPPKCVMEMSTQVDLHTAQAYDDWCSLMTDFSSVDKLDQAFKEAKEEAIKYFELCKAAQSQITDLQTELDTLQQTAATNLQQLSNEHSTHIAALTADNQHLRQTLQDLNNTHNNLMQDSLRHLDEIANLRTKLSKTDNASQTALLELIRAHLLSLPTDFDDDDTPDDALYHFLCCHPSASHETLVQHANTLLRFLHPDKTDDCSSSNIAAAARLVPLLTSIKRVLTRPPLRAVYDHCGLVGLKRLLDDNLRCFTCAPRDSDYCRLPQGRMEYPHLCVLFSLGSF